MPVRAAPRRPGASATKRTVASSAPLASPRIWTWFMSVQSKHCCTRAHSFSNRAARSLSMGDGGGMSDTVHHTTAIGETLALVQWRRSGMYSPFGSEHDESRWLLKALRESSHELDAQLWGLEEEELRWRESEEGWSLKEIAAHLRDCEEHFLQALESIATKADPRIPALDADALVRERDYREVDIYETLEQLSEMRQRAVLLLWEQDWERTGTHQYLGPVSISQLARQQSRHDLEHLWQARRLREALTER